MNLTVFKKEGLLRHPRVQTRDKTLEIPGLYIGMKRGIQMIKIVIRKPRQTFYERVWGIPVLIFGFVSDFDIRISDFKLSSIRKLCRRAKKQKISERARK